MPKEPDNASVQERGKRKVDFYRHSIPASESQRIAEVLSTPFLTTGPVCRQVEEQLKAFFSTSEAITVNSWTNGAIATLLAMDIGPGDEVVVPAMTFVATANVVEMVGARPVFVDVDPGTLLMDLDKVEKAIGPATRAIIPVHLYGQMVDIKALRDLPGMREGIAIIEDCAHCFEGSIRGERPGTHGDVAIFSFYATKNVACGEGGAVVLKDATLADRIRQARQHGMSAGAEDRFKTGGYRHWDVEHLGTKANLPDILAALLPAQIADVHQRQRVRADLAGKYRRSLADSPYRLPHWLPEQVHAHHLFPISVPNEQRDAVLGRLAAEGIGATVNYRSVPMLAFYQKKYGYNAADHPHAYRWGNETISLPLYPGMDEADLAYVSEVLLDEAGRNIQVDTTSTPSGH